MSVGGLLGFYETPTNRLMLEAGDTLYPSTVDWQALQAQLLKLGIPPNPPIEQTRISVSLRREEWDTVIELLGHAPYNKVAHLILAIQAQLPLSLLAPMPEPLVLRAPVREGTALELAYDRLEAISGQIGELRCEEARVTERIIELTIAREPEPDVLCILCRQRWPWGDTDAG